MGQGKDHLQVTHVQLAILSVNGESSPASHVCGPMTEASSGCPRVASRRQPLVLLFLSLLSGNGNEIIIALPSFQHNSILLLALGLFLEELAPALEFSYFPYYFCSVSFVLD